MGDRPPHRAMELLQTATTISAIAIALATISLDDGPAIGDLHLIPISFLVAGLVALAGSLYAMADVWRETGRPMRDLLGRWDPAFHPSNPSGYVALRLTTWGPVILGFAYIFLFIASGP